MSLLLHVLLSLIILHTFDYQDRYKYLNHDSNLLTILRDKWSLQMTNICQFLIFFCESQVPLGMFHLSYTIFHKFQRETSHQGHIYNPWEKTQLCFSSLLTNWLRLYLFWVCSFPNRNIYFIMIFTDIFILHNYRQINKPKSFHFLPSIQFFSI